jgi:hypothetical protein
MSQRIKMEYNKSSLGLRVSLNYRKMARKSGTIYCITFCFFSSAS